MQRARLIIEYEVYNYGSTNGIAGCFSSTTWSLQSGQELCPVVNDYLTIPLAWKN